MSNITNKGRELAERFGRYLGWTPDLSATCSLIARHATSHNGYQEAWCSVEMSDRQIERMEAREARCEARLTALIERLPEHNEYGRWRAVFSGDPRGFTVRAVAGPVEVGCFV
jgi:hypothetical protein